jgi:hypothetical protein
VGGGLRGVYVRMCFVRVREGSRGGLVGGGDICRGAC